MKVEFVLRKGLGMKIIKRTFLVVAILSCSGCSSNENAVINNKEDISIVSESKENANINSEIISDIDNDYIQYEDNNEVIIEYGNLPGNIINKGYVIDNDIFFTFKSMNSRSALYKYDIANDKISFIMDNCDGSLNIKDDKLFFSNKEGIFSCDFDGKNIEQCYQSQNSQCSFIIYDDSIYLIDSYIFKVDILTKKVQQLNSIESNYLNVTKDKIYYTSQDAFSEEYIENMHDSDLGVEGNIYQMNLDGSDNKMLSDKIVSELIASEDALYYISLDSVLIERFDPVSLENEKVSDATYFNFNISEDKIYASNADGIDILNINGEQLKHYDIEPSPRDTFLNIVDNCIYYRRFGEDGIYQLDMNTSIYDMFYSIPISE